MDPCPFVRILVGNLALKVPAGMKPSLDSTTPCYCKVKFHNFAIQKATVPLLQDQQNQTTSSNTNLAACFTLTKPQIEKLARSNKGKTLKIEIYSSNVNGCGLGGGGKLLGSVVLPLVDIKKAETRAVVIHNGWIDIGKKIPKMEVFLSVRVEPDPRYVFEFGGEPECSPQVFQVQGSVRQAVFTCKFSLRSSGDRNLGSRPSMSETGTSRNWFPSLGGDKDQQLAKERKGWSITIHDLSGSPVAMASMVTPFVPSPGSDHVSGSNPGGWLILRPSSGTWKPWGRLEAWRERRNTLGYRFELLHDAILASPAMTTSVNSVISTIEGGKFVIDMTNNVTTPTTSPHSSWDFGSNSGGSGSWSGSEAASGMSPFLYKGFVMSSTVKGDGECSKPEVEIGVQHVNCTEDAAAFVALAAAVDLSMDACKLFSHNLRKELRQQSQSFVV